MASGRTDGEGLRKGIRVFTDNCLIATIGNGFDGLDLEPLMGLSLQSYLLRVGG